MTPRLNASAPTFDRTAVELAGMTGDLFGTPDSRAPLVLLAGLSFDRRIWQPVLARLAEIDPGRRVLTLDLPGHGDSPPQLPHTFERIETLLNRAFDGAGLAAPVLVGHSMSGGLVGMYAARYPTSGVINLDAAPDLDNIARLLQSVSGQIRGAGFASVWAMMHKSFRTDLLPPEFRELVAANGDPRQDLVVSYWAQLLEKRPEQLRADVLASMRALAATGAPYLFIAGTEPSDDVRQMFEREVPDAVIEVWADGGHFPHLAYLDRFADRLAATGQAVGWGHSSVAVLRGQATSAEVPPVRRSSSA